MQKENKQLLIITHLSQLLDVITGCGGFIVPLIIWLTQKDSIANMDENGKAILNFRISMFLYLILSVPLILLFGLGLLGILGVSILLFVFPIVNAVRVSNGQEPYYPMSIKFL
ncbi:DUF4870 domain-containing protein [Cellulophaga baltica]|uniref:DUF4870 domain-containing protein n=1 Tax=Cellulophaga TaxID=104264 RepID=UPI001C0750D0|nr:MULTISPECIES: DUF4870 domain-containing protein [Cellulophaga]MBU2996821.1 DUF4870 domain-containing protein [Cellulophaga baltica]MDO6768218.1 DUF4870 domain-containing protein [Cellulophaga sp. 1_MG-2023]